MSWLLITSLPIDSVDAVLRIIDYYVARWPIETFFRTYKTGCRVEEIQLETNHRPLNALMFYKIVARHGGSGDLAGDARDGVGS